MRMSCNGCRVLRKRCNESCIIRPCIQWIINPEAQGNATMFLAKFYGRSGLINRLMAVPPHLRPSIFRSLMYEACGRIIDPIYGSMGLYATNRWDQCEAAVNSVLTGYPIMRVPTNAACPYQFIPLRSCDIRHLPKEHNVCNPVGNGKAPMVQPEPESEVMIRRYEGDQSRSEASSSTVHFEQMKMEHVPIFRDFFGADVDTVETSLGLGNGSSRAAKRRRRNPDVTVEVDLELKL